MQRRYFILLIVGFAGLARAHAAGAAESRAVPVVERSDDDLVLVQLRLGRLILNESLPGYLVKNHLILPLGQVAQALEFPIRVNAPEGQAEGWFLDPANHFTLDAARREVVIAGNRGTFTPDQVEVHKDDIYVDSALLSQWWPVEFKFSFATQTVTVSGRDGTLLPVEREAARDRAESALAGRHPEAQGPFPRLDTPYSLYTIPFTDITYTAGVDQQSDVGPHNGITALANGDLLYMHSSAYIAADTAQKITDLRWTLSRRDPDGQLWRPDDWMCNTALGEAMNEYKVKDLEFGDINTQQLPLTAFNQLGRGFMISTIPYDRATNYNRTTLQGDLQPGWEVELYRNDELLQFQRATSDGRYSFIDVPLVSGLNIVRLKFYGPFGQTRQEVKRFLVTPDLTGQGKSYFRFSVSQQETSLLQIASQNLTAASSQAGATPLQADIIRGKPRTLFEYEYGITNNLSLFANTASLTTPDDIDRHYLSAGLGTALGGAYGRADVAHDTTGGGNALEMLLQDNLFGISLSGDSQLFRNGFISEFTEQTDDPVKSRTTARADAPFKIPYLPQFNTGISDSYVTYSSGRIVDDLSGRISTSIGRIAVSHVLTYRSDTSPEAEPLAALFPTTLPTSNTTVLPSDKQTTGELIVSVPFNRVTLRGDMLYGIEPERNIQTLISAVEYAITPATNAMFEVDKQLVDQPLTTYTVTLNHRLFDKLLIGASASHSNDGKNALGLNVSLAVGENPRTGGFEVYPDNTARDGIIDVRAFHDGNGDGVFEDGEDPIPDAKFRINHGNSNLPTGQDGTVLLRNIPPDTRTSLSLDGDSLENPYFLNNKPGLDIVARAGVPVTVDFPVASSGDVEGTVYMEENGSRQAVSDVVVQVISGDGKVIRENENRLRRLLFNQRAAHRAVQPARLARPGRPARLQRRFRPRLPRDQQGGYQSRAGYGDLERRIEN